MRCSTRPFSMFLHALATAVPDAAFTQPECWDIVQKSQCAPA
jgi:hypothetical protein